MPLQRHTTDFENLAPETLAAWREIPPAIVSDCMNRTHFMAAAIKPLKPGTVLAGQARTVTSMVGDNGISHAALALVNKGEVLVIDAGGYEDVAVWGSIMTHAAMARDIAGVVIDGAVRDAAEIRELGFACYARANVPSGPHKGFGGSVNAPIGCAGVAVDPGDLVVGDGDGVVVVRPDQMAGLLDRCRARIAKEEGILAKLDAGEDSYVLQGLPPPDSYG